MSDDQNIQIGTVDLGEASVIWQDPPPPKSKFGAGRTLKHAAFYRTLEQNPGRWAVYPEDREYNVSEGMRKRGFKVTTRRMTSPTGQKFNRTWVKFDPPQED
jgi:hypothetical protein